MRNLNNNYYYNSCTQVNSSSIMASSAIVTPPSLTEQENAKEEPIMFEGVCRTKCIIAEACLTLTAFISLFSMMFPLFLIIYIICIPCFITCGIFVGRHKAKTWRLYLTKSAIHYVFNGVPLNILLADIEDIAVNYYCCITEIKITLHPDKAHIYSPKPLCECCRVVPNKYLKYCKNANEFVEAVVQQLPHVGE